MRYLRTDTVQLNDLHPYPGNARTHDAASLDESVKLNGQYRSIVARLQLDGSLQILAGHGTVEALDRAGDSTARVEVIDADDTEARRIVLADNGTSRNAGYDEPALLALLDGASRDGGISGTGWDTEAWQLLLNPLPDNDSGDTGTDTAAKLAEGNQYSILVVARDEEQQAELLERFDEEGLECRPFTM